MLVRTTLPTLDFNGIIQFDYETELWQRAVSAMEYVNHTDVAESNTKLLPLDDALHSAQIEGAHTTLDALLSNEKNESTYMVWNALKAQLYLREHSVSSHDTLTTAWKKIMPDMPDEGYRDTMVYVDSESRVVHTPAKPSMLRTLMHSLFNYTSMNTVLDAIIWHFYTVYVHTFRDGNGRLARALCVAKLCDKSLPLSKAIECRSSGYYASLQTVQVGDNVDISEHVEYMLRAIISAASMYKLYTQELTADESKLMRVIDVTGKGFVSNKKADAILGCESRSVLESLRYKGFLEFTGDDYKVKWR